jgi:hypothetical protein
MAEWERPLPPGGKRILVVHGGLWRANPSGMSIGSLRDLASVPRQDDNPEHSCVEDALWSDPGNPTEPGSVGVRKNGVRGAGIYYGTGAVDAFFAREGLCGLIRAHEGPDARAIGRDGMGNMMDGYSVDMEVSCGYVATVFSSADYPMGPAAAGNKGCVATIAGRASCEASAGMMPVFTSFVSNRPVFTSAFYVPPPSEKDRPSTPRSR